MRAKKREEQLQELKAAALVGDLEALKRLLLPAAEPQTAARCKQDTGNRAKASIVLAGTYEQDGGGTLLHYLCCGSNIKQLPAGPTNRTGQQHAHLKKSAQGTARARAKALAWLLEPAQASLWPYLPLSSISHRCWSVLHCCLFNGGCIEALLILLEGLPVELQSEKPDVCLEDACGHTPLEWAAGTCNWEAMKILIRHGALDDCSGLRAAGAQVASALSPSLAAPPARAAASARAATPTPALRAIPRAGTLHLVLQCMLPWTARMLTWLVAWLPRMLVWGPGPVGDVRTQAIEAQVASCVWGAPEHHVLGSGARDPLTFGPPQQLAGAGLPEWIVLGAAAEVVSHMQARETQVADALRVSAPIARQLLIQHDCDPIAALEAGYMLKLISGGSARNALSPAAWSNPNLKEACVVCMESSPQTQFSVSMPCGHQCCDACWRGILFARLDDGNPHKACCPVPDCRLPIPLELTLQLLPAKRHARWLRLQAAHFIQCCPDASWCPSPGCGRSIHLCTTTTAITSSNHTGAADAAAATTAPASNGHSGANTATATPTTATNTGGHGPMPAPCQACNTASAGAQRCHAACKQTTCGRPAGADACTGHAGAVAQSVAEQQWNVPRALLLRWVYGVRGAGVQCDCGTRFCFKCSAPVHEPATCQQVAAWQRLLQQEALAAESDTASFISHNTKPCPKCRSPVEKNGGCNHMKCTRCNAEWCWVCSDYWSLHGPATGGFYRCNRVSNPASSAPSSGLVARRAGTHQSFQRRTFHEYLPAFLHACEDRLTRAPAVAGRMAWLASLLPPSTLPAAPVAPAASPSCMQASFKGTGAAHAQQVPMQSSTAAATGGTRGRGQGPRQQQGQESQAQGQGQRQLRQQQQTECRHVQDPLEYQQQAVQEHEGQLPPAEFMQVWLDCVCASLEVLRWSHVLRFHAAMEGACLAPSNRYLEDMVARLNAVTDQLLAPIERLPHANQVPITPLESSTSGDAQQDASHSSSSGSLLAMLKSAARRMQATMSKAAAAAPAPSPLARTRSSTHRVYDALWRLSGWSKPRPRQPRGSAEGQASSHQQGRGEESDSDPPEESGEGSDVAPSAHRPPTPRCPLLVAAPPATAQGNAGLQVHEQLLYTLSLLQEQNVCALRTGMQEAAFLRECIIQAGRAGCFTLPSEAPPPLTSQRLPSGMHPTGAGLAWVARLLQGIGRRAGTLCRGAVSRLFHRPGV